ncbi:MAG: dihydrodipicolinate synthase family protein [Phycisphaeraceae bacterium]|nr:dihydrodipicolinate synthase family protein [Phycisphaeraceae bacterium]
MLTSFDSSGQVDHASLRALVDWYLAHGAAGLFALCLSSEPYQLGADERMEVLETVLDANAGRVPVVVGALGHTDRSELIEEIRLLGKCDVKGVVLHTGELIAPEAGDEQLIPVLEEICEATDDVPLGLYECPYPKRRYLGSASVDWVAQCDRIVYVKATSHDIRVIEDRCRRWRGSAIMHCQAYACNVLAALKVGLDGFSGIASNFYPALCAWICSNYETEPALAARVQEFLARHNDLTARHYPTSAKYYLNKHVNPRFAPITRYETSPLAEEDRIALDHLAVESRELLEVCLPK